MYEWLKKHKRIFFVVQILYRLVKGDREFFNAIINWNNDPQYISLKHSGNYNSGKIIYIIKEQGNGYGFFAEFKCLLEKLFFADLHGFIPYIYFDEDYLYYDNTIDDEKNAFKYYFNAKVEVSTPFESENILVSRGCDCEYVERRFCSMGYSQTYEFEECLVNTLRKYILIKKDMLDEFDEVISRMFQNNKVLGIHYRGTDFKVGYNNHPTVVQIGQVIEAVKQAIKEDKFQLIFLATDEKGVYDILYNEFGDKLVWYKDVYRGDGNNSIAFSKDDRKNHSYRLGKEVLRDAYTLSKCEGLIAGLSQVSFGARILKKSRSEEYIYYKCIDNGINVSKNTFNAGKSM